MKPDLRHLALGAFAVAAIASPVAAQPVATSRLGAGAGGDCLVVSGRRSAAAAIVSINGHAVEASGGRRWQVRLPMATVRDWSAPFARTLQVAVTDRAGTIERSGESRLPIGLLGGRIELASLVVRAR